MFLQNWVPLNEKNQVMNAKLQIFLCSGMVSCCKIIILFTLQVSEMIDKYQAGLTPNPDILCNSRIKFGAFLDHIHLEEFDRIASGHYARVERVVDKNGKTQTFLHLSLDEVSITLLKSL
ncbi:hypothetical protein O6H91_Y499500 [Diphasiastrum complanatum]|nr:hypothetical protein O6H91_Y499500 [Diphasiastrum complanatum]